VMVWAIMALASGFLHLLRSVHMTPAALRAKYLVIRISMGRVFFSLRVRV
jgi:hypothetical protein